MEQERIKAVKSEEKATSDGAGNPFQSVCWHLWLGVNVVKVLVCRMACETRAVFGGTPRKRLMDRVCKLDGKGVVDRGGVEFKEVGETVGIFDFFQ